MVKQQKYQLILGAQAFLVHAELQGNRKKKEQTNRDWNRHHKRRPPMPISTLISLIPETDVTLRPTMGHHAHAAFLSRLYGKAIQISRKRSTHNRHKSLLPSHPWLRRARGEEIISTSKQVLSADFDSPSSMTSCFNTSGKPFWRSRCHRFA